MPTLARAHVLRGAAELRGELTSVSWSAEVDLRDFTSFADAARTWEVGLTSAEIAFEGFFAATPFDAVVAADLGAATPVPVSVGPDGVDQAGKRAYVVAARAQQYEISSRTAELVGASVSYRSDARIGLGVVLAELAARGSSGTGPTQDNGASTSNGAIANLHVTAASGTLDVKVQHSADQVTWVDLITFSTVTSPAAESKVVTGTVNRYVRATWTVGGASPSFTFAVTFAR